MAVSKNIVARIVYPKVAMLMHSSVKGMLNNYFFLSQAQGILASHVVLSGKSDHACVLLRRGPALLASLHQSFREAWSSFFSFDASVTAYSRLKEKARK